MDFFKDNELDANSNKVQVIYKYFLFGALVFYSRILFSQDQLSLSAMIYTENQRLYRGAQIWDKPNTMIGISAVFWERLEWRGPLLDYHFFNRKDPLLLDLGLRFFSDSPPLIRIDDGKADYRNQRGNALDFLFNFKYKFGWKNLFAIGFEYYQEIIEHQGQYIKPIIEAPVLPWTKMSLAAGFGSRKANQFTYGPSAQSGLGHIDLTLNNVILKIPWQGIIINQLGSVWVVGTANRKADYIRGNDHHYFFSTRIIWEFY